MADAGSVTECMHELANSETSVRDNAALKLWEYFFSDLMCYASRRLRAANASRGWADEEDAAERAFTKVCLGIERGQLKLGNRVDLSKVLHSATTREVLTLLQNAKRNAGRTIGASPLMNIPDPDLTAEILVPAYEACQRLLNLLESDSLRQVAIWKLAGHTNEEIRIKLGCSVVTVERALATIRETWRRKMDQALCLGPAKSGPRHNSRTSENACEADGIDQLFDQDDEFLRSLTGLG
jgi:DNA-directed RNA polymerase specialized sigma24 family protein